MDAFEKHIRSVFDNHEVPLNTQELWESVEPRLKKRRLPRGLFFFLLFGVGLTTVILLVDKPSSKAEQQWASQESITNTVFGRKGQLVKNISTTDTQQTAQTENELPSVLPGNAQTKKNTIINRPAKEQDHKIFFPNDLVKDNDEVAESIVNIKDPVRPVRPGVLISTKKVATNTKIQPVISLYESQIMQPFSPSLKSSPFRFSFDIFGGLDLAQKSLKAKSYDYLWYRNERRSSEHILESFNFGVHINGTHRSGLQAGTGLVYQQINELFESNSSAEIRYFVEGVVEIVTNADGSSSQVTGQKLVINEKRWNKKKYNSYRYINVPVYVGYSFAVKNFQYEITSGLNFNISFSQEGEIIGKEGFPVSLSDTQNSIFRKYSSVDLNGGIKLLYPFSESFIVYAEPNFQYNLFSITEKEYPLEQRYFHGGIRIGTRILF